MQKIQKMMKVKITVAVIHGLQKSVTATPGSSNPSYESCSSASYSRTNRNMDIFGVFIQLWIPELGHGDSMPLEVAGPSVCCLFYIERCNAHEIVQFLDSHRILPPHVRSNLDLEGSVDQYHDEPRATTGIPETAIHREEDSNNISDTTKVNLPEVSLDLSQGEHDNYFLQYPDGHVNVVISEEYEDSSRFQPN